MFNKKVELPMPIFFILLSLSMLCYCTLIPRQEAIFLVIISVVILAAAVPLLIATLKFELCNVDLEDVDLRKVFIMLGALALYALCLKTVGYVASTLSLGVFIVRLLGYKSWGKNLIFCIVVTALVFFVFRIILGVPLPMVFLMD